ncbi:hypothetical protein [Pseudoalteromonas luteoviolacea]|uniref:Uncharacterized protein n=1 Tax=Pseudoalteromonas luteoviolacea NCIMB 1942 TaxID=1365253 RepID=A0A166Z4D3_9GAMM|nr:hypothetical protein [Pseudoalteromonas luteoviolacea]KZN43826.1 hypothetical protein N482_18530 [Pseudoalteromonas luteoviolacea NCIMB 1942]
MTYDETNSYQAAIPISAFDGGAKVEASASPTIVPLPYSNEAHIDPEEAYGVSQSSCHMLLFLHFAAKAGLMWIAMLIAQKA